MGAHAYRSRRRWTTADAQVMLAELASSGLSIAEFAEKTGLDVNRVYRWRRRIGSSASVALAKRPAFIEVKRPAHAVEVLLRSGRVLRFSEGIDTAALARIADALEC